MFEDDLTKLFFFYIIDDTFMQTGLCLIVSLKVAKFSLGIIYVVVETRL